MDIWEWSLSRVFYWKLFPSWVRVEEWPQTRPKQYRNISGLFCKKDAFSPLHFVITLSSPPLPSLPKLTRATSKYKTTITQRQQCASMLSQNEQENQNHLTSVSHEAIISLSHLGKYQYSIFWQKPYLQGISWKMQNIIDLTCSSGFWPLCIKILFCVVSIKEQFHPLPLISQKCKQTLQVKYETLWLVTRS